MSTHADCYDCARSTSGDCGRHRLPVMGVVVPVPGTAPLPAATVTVVLTCAAHPGEPAIGACAACLRDARKGAEKAEAERDAARREAAGVVAADAANQRAQLADAGLLDEFAAWIGCDLAEHLAEAIVAARGERDAARREAAEAQAREAKLREALDARNFCCRNVGTFADTDGSGGWCGECKEARKTTIGVIVAPADRAALDALLARARREVARACVEAARDEVDGYSEANDMRSAAEGVLAAVERAAREAGAKERSVAIAALREALQVAVDALAVCGGPVNDGLGAPLGCAVCLSLPHIEGCPVGAALAKAAALGIAAREASAKEPTP